MLVNGTEGIVENLLAYILHKTQTCFLSLLVGSLENIERDGVSAIL